MADLVRNARRHLMQAGLLTELPGERLVPDLILRSWRRSIVGSADSEAPCARFDEVDTDSVLCRAASPVLDRWQGQLVDTGTTLFLSDRAGSIVARRVGDSGLRRRLDKVHAAEGFDYSEDSVGTNGLGTSMAEGRAVYIRGSQHFNDTLSVLACAAVPVRSPAGSVIGSVSLGGPIADASPLMLSLTREIGSQIEERLKASARPQDLAMAMSFMRYTNSRRPTVVMDNESLLANTPGLSYVDVSSHVVLWDMLTEHNWSHGGTARLRPDSMGVEVTARRVLEGPRAHYVLHFSDPRDDAPTTTGRRTASPLGGRSTTRVAQSGVSVVEGPRGSGRATKAVDLLAADRAVGPPPVTFEMSALCDTAWDEIDESLSGGDDVLIRRVENARDHEVDRLVARVSTHRAAVVDGSRSNALVLTVCRDRAARRVQAIVDEIGVAERTRPLSEAPESIPVLVTSILDRLDTDRRHSLSPAALQSMVAWSWPGNITELVDTMSTVLTQVSASVIERRHLPVHLQQSRPAKRLSLIEAAEREAIVKALAAADGNKSEAATLLGIGRTTLYRRLRQLGLDSSEHSL